MNEPPYPIDPLTEEEAAAIALLKERGLIPKEFDPDIHLLVGREISR